MSRDDAHCPHCHHLLLVAAPSPYPTRPLRCPSCHLIVAPGRTVDEHGLLRRAGRPGPLGSDPVLDVLLDLQIGVRPVSPDDAGSAMER